MPSEQEQRKKILTTTKERRKVILILGAGFGGLRCALTLERILKEHRMMKKAQIVLVDKNRYHSFIPALYEVASASPSLSEETLYARTNILIKTIILKKDIRFIKGEVMRINIKDQFAEFADGSGQEFDYLVIALGSETNFYGIPGLEKQCLQLKDYTDALRIRRAVKLGDNVPKQIIVAGGGTSGVELAAELCKSLKGIPVSITLAEGESKILPSFSEAVSHIAASRLRKLHIVLKLGHYIKKVDEKEITLDSDEKMSYDCLFWTAGIKGHRLFETLPLQKEKNGMIKSSSCLHPFDDKDKSLDNIYVIGDAGSFEDKKGHILPWTAQKAIGEGRKTAYSILRSLQGLHETRCYPEKSRFIIPVGGKWAITELHSFLYAGFGGWVLKSTVELKYLLSILPVNKACCYWARTVWTFSRND